MKTLVYLASPYSHDDQAVRQWRFDRINEAASFLMRRGLHIFSPISECHPIAMAGGLPTDWAFWKDYDEAILSMCRALVVLMLPGWDKSTGVAGETQIARRLDIEMLWTYPDDAHLAEVADALGRTVEEVR